MIQKTFDNIKLNLYLAESKIQPKRKFDGKKISFGVFALLAILGLVVQPLNMVLAANPRFNIFTPYTCTWAYNQDYYLICVKNDTQGTTWNTSVSANPGDTLTFSVYYHNGVNETTATNTKLRVSIPSGQSTSQTVTAYLWADNAENANQSYPFTYSNTINISSAQSLEYIQNSAKWYPDQRSPLTDSSVSFLYGQTGNEIVSNGVNVGDVIGCWEYSGMVNFQVRVSQVVYAPDLTISKKVRNITNNETVFSEATGAKNGDRLAFSLKIDSIGNTTAQNVIVFDSLPSQLSYVSGSLRVDGSSSYSSVNFFGSGINIGSIAAGSSKNVTFEATVNTNTNLTVTNYGYARADQVSQKQDTALVYISEIVLSRDLSIVKKVRNITDGQFLFYDQVDARPRQTLEFLITVTATGEAEINNVIVRDQLPDKLLYVAGSTRVDGVSFGDGIVSGGINIGTIQPGSDKEIKFQVNIEREVMFPRGQTTLTNYGYARADSVSEKSDSAGVVVIYSGCDPEKNSPGKR